MGDNTTSGTPRRTTYAVHQSMLTGTGMVLNAAAAADLPAPFLVLPARDETALIFDPEHGFDDFTTWATWLDVAPFFDGWYDQAVQRWAAEAVLFDVTIRLSVRKRVQLVCPRCDHVVGRHDVVGCGDCRGGGGCYHSRAQATQLAEDKMAREARQAVTV